MTSPKPRIRYALVVPSSAVEAAERVPANVGKALGIDVYEVTDDDTVRKPPAAIAHSDVVRRLSPDWTPSSTAFSDSRRSSTGSKPNSAS